MSEIRAEKIAKAHHLRDRKVLNRYPYVSVMKILADMANIQNESIKKIELHLGLSPPTEESLIIMRKAKIMLHTVNSIYVVADRIVRQINEMEPEELIKFNPEQEELWHA